MSDSLIQLPNVAKKLRDAGASLPAPEVTGTPEGAVKTGLSIALAVVEEAIEQAASTSRTNVGPWQSIETVPTDKTRVLALFDDSGHVEDAQFYRDDEDDSLRYFLFDGDMLMSSKPIAWMPYPEREAQ